MQSQRLSISQEIQTSTVACKNECSISPIMPMTSDLDVNVHVQYSVSFIPC